MLMTLKNRQILDLAEGIVRIDQLKLEEVSAIFNYALTLNEEKVKAKAEAIIEMQIRSPKYLEYEQEEHNIVNQFSDKDDDGNTITVGDGNIIKIDDTKKDDFNSAMVDLYNKHKETIQKRSKDLDDFKDVLDDEFELDIETIRLEDLPVEVSRDRQLMRFIITMIQKT